MKLNPNGKTAKQDLWSGLYSDANINSYANRHLDELNDNATLSDLKDLFMKAYADPLSTKPIESAMFPDNTGLGSTTALAGNWIRDNKLKTAGLLGTGAANVAGLFDNPNIIGQLAGLGGGFAAGKMLIPKLTKNPLTGSGLALATMGGGALGSLFDTLMANKSQSQQY